MSRQNSHIYFLQKKPLQYGLSLIRTTDTKSRPKRVNSYKLIKPLYCGHCGDQVNPESRSDESAQRESRLADELCKVTLKAQSLYIIQRFPTGVQRNILTDFFKA